MKEKKRKKKRLAETATIPDSNAGISMECKHKLRPKKEEEEEERKKEG